MPSGVRLGPAELDRIEDALEDLELVSPSDLDADDVVGQELLEFRELLKLSREAMPLEEVPPGLLDGVIEEAQQVAANTAPAPAESWWSRLRVGVWMPTLAFAGSAALLLVLLWPAAEDGGVADDTVARAEPESPAAAPIAEAPAEGEQRLADAKLEQTDRDANADPFGLREPERGDALGLGRAGAAEDVLETEEALEEEPEEPAAVAKGSKPKPARSRASTGSSSGSAKAGKKSSGGVYDEPVLPAPKSPAPGASSGDKKKDSGPDLMFEVQQGDKARRAGNCGLARMRYDKARQTSNDRVRARALAGKGLCEEAAGNSGKAKKLFDQARAADPGVDAFIKTELRRLGDDEPQVADEADESPVQTKD